MIYVRYLHHGRVCIGRMQDRAVVPLSAASLVQALTEPATENGPSVPLSEVVLLPAVDDGAKVLCVALNYVDHAKESSQPVPASPLIFFKSREAMIAAGDPITPPRAVRQLDYEGEIAILIGKEAFEISRDQAWDHIAGVTAFNDTSARDLFRVKAGEGSHLDWFSGKCIDRSTPLGPGVVPLAEVLAGLQAGTTRVRTKVNGEVRQDAPVGDMIFDIPTLVAFAASRVRLSPGDIIATGTPPGVGAGTGRFITSGDVVRIEVDGLMPLENTVA